MTINDASYAGMMEGCFFVPRSDLINWLRDEFRIDINKVEQCANGAMYLQIVDRMFPGKVPMSKINWGAKFNYDFLKNYKLLQEVFERCQVKKHIEIERLTRAKYQDNLEFLQWLKCLYDRNNGGSRSYNAIERRQLGQGCQPVTGLEWLRPLTNGKQLHNPTEKASQKVTVVDTAPVKTAQQLPQHNTAPATETVSNLKAKIIELEDEVQTACSESKFYFKKLRQLEILCNGKEGETIPVADLEAILYAEDDGVSDSENMNSG